MKNALTSGLYKKFSEKLQQHTYQQEYQDSEKTELEIKLGTTQYEIELGFWVAGDRVLFLTRNRSYENHEPIQEFYIEEFRFEGPGNTSRSCQPPSLVCKSFKELKLLQYAFDYKRYTVAMIIQEQCQNTKEVFLRSCYIFTADNLSYFDKKIQLPKDSSLDFKMSFIKDYKKISQSKLLILQQDHDGSERQLDLYLGTPVQKFKVAHLLEQKNKERVVGLFCIKEKVLMISSDGSIQYGMTLVETQEIRQRKSLALGVIKKVIGVFSPDQKQKNQTKLDIKPEFLHGRDESYVLQGAGYMNQKLKTKIGHVKNCFIQRFFQQVEAQSEFVLVLEGSELVFEIFKLYNNQWKKIMKLGKNQFKLRPGFSNFMVGKKFGKNHLSILELGPTTDEKYQIISRLPLHQRSSDALFIETFDENPSFAVEYEANQKQFCWKKTQLFQQVFPERNNKITQICGNYLIRFDTNVVESSHHIELCNLNLLIKSELFKEKHSFKVALGAGKEEKIRSFYPEISSDQKAILLLLQVQKYGNKLKKDGKNVVYNRLIYIFNLPENDSVYIQKKNSRLSLSKSIDFEPKLRDFSFSEEFTSAKIVGNGDDTLIICQTKNRLTVINPTEKVFKKQSSYLKAIKMSQTLSQAQNIRSTMSNEPIEHPHFNFDQEVQIVGVRGDLLYIASEIGDDSDQILIKSLKLSRSMLLGDQAPEENDVATFQIPSPDTVDHWDLCFAIDDKIDTPIDKGDTQRKTLDIVALYAIKEERFGVIETYRINNSKSIGITKPRQSFKVPCYSPIRIMPLNMSQLTIESRHGFTVVNISESKKSEDERQRKEFQVFYCAKSLSERITSNKGVVAIPKCQGIKEGAIYKFGLDPEACKSDDQRFNCRTFNDIRTLFQQAYNMDQMYLEIDREQLKAQNANRYLVIKVMLKDYVLSKEQKTYQLYTPNFEDLEKVKMNAPQQCNKVQIWHDVVLVQHQYQIQRNIFDSYLRVNGLLEGRLKYHNFEEKQLSRIIDPVLTDKNQNLLHHLSTRKTEKLQTILNMVKRALYLETNLKFKRQVIFDNFKGDSQIEIAFKTSNYNNFEIMLDLMIKQKPTIREHHMISDILIDAMKENLNLVDAFNSALFTDFLDSPSFNSYSQQFPKFLDSKESFSKQIKAQRKELMFSPSLNKIFPQPKDKIKQHKKLIPVTYIVDYIFIFYEDSKYHTKFLLALAEPNNLRYFQTKFIQRHVDFLWQIHKHRYYFQFGVFVFNYALLIIAIQQTDYDVNNTIENEYWLRRFIINAVNLVILLLTDTIFKGREFYHLGFKRYFKKRNNIITMLFFFCFCVTFALDTYGSIEKASRISYACTCLSGFGKFLMLARMFSMFNFIIKMVLKTVSEILPFLILFFAFSMVFGQMMNILGVNLQHLGEEDYDHDDNVYQGTGILSHQIYAYRNSLGDYDLEQFNDLLDHGGVYWACWATWFIGSFANAIIFLNFLIAFVSEIYTTVMATRQEEEYQKRAELLADIIEMDRIPNAYCCWRKQQKSGGIDWPRVLVHRQPDGFNEEDQTGVIKAVQQNHDILIDTRQVLTAMQQENRDMKQQSKNVSDSTNIKLNNIQKDMESLKEQNKNLVKLIQNLTQERLSSSYRSSSSNTEDSQQFFQINDQ